MPLSRSSRSTWVRRCGAALSHASPTQGPQYRALLDAHRSFRDLELACRLANGALVHMSLNGEPVFDAEGALRGYGGTAKDITESKLAQQRIARLKDMYAAMSEANGVIVHSSSQQALFDAICRIAVEYVHFAFARVALLDFKTDGGNGRLRRGRQGSSAPLRGLHRSPHPRGGQGFSGHALRSGINVVCNDILTEPRTRPWRDTLSDLGVRSTATLALRCQGKVVGTLQSCTRPRPTFDDELVGLLEKLTMNLSFALDNFQREDARRTAQRALRESETRFRDFAAAAGEYVWGRRPRRTA